MGGFGFVARRRRQLDGNRFPGAAFPCDRNLDRLTGLLEPHPLLQLRDRFDRLAVDCDDDIALLEAGALGGRIVVGESLDHGALDVRKLDVLRVLRPHRQHGNPQHRALDVTGRNQLRHDGAGEVDRDCKPVAGIESGLTGDVDQRSSRVTGIDRGVCLNEVLNRVAALVQSGEQPPFGAHDPGRNRKRECFAERIADGQDPVADLRGIGVPQVHRRQPGSLNLDYRNVRGRIGTDGLCGKLAVVIQAHRNAVGALDDVVVREDVAILRYNEARPGPLLHLGTARGVEEVVKTRHPPAGDPLPTFRLDEHHRRLYVLGDRSKCLAQIDGRLRLRQGPARVLKY